ncbi:hypothetical protein QQS21_003708 [Conoideocrella luteorostrata]|uniref:HET-domain-containing protein n=1 Tax=Conoideocrella luteorostrata TaxID=1105319 RepID=A0AAJ0FW46_9HYPO|nr:hypothetical protein QQS21_003708 [Conoideocrella luteorostrata]
MRLLNTTTLQLELFTSSPPPYAVLSHRWQQHEEVTFQALQQHDSIRQLRGYDKLQASAGVARASGYSYIWLDTCCIDKTSSAELSEAINSMFSWYQAAEVCLAYLWDVDTVDDLQLSEWFRRGWTLQELVAPKSVQFFNREWRVLGSKAQLKSLLSSITGLSEAVLAGAVRLDAVPACNKLSWAACRDTTRPEDMAYSLMGLLNVNMPLLYGEGSQRAFRRLQEEFVRASDDESIFAWTVEEADTDDNDADERERDKAYWGLLAPSPRCFKCSSELTIPRFKAYRYGQPTEITNHGLRIALALQPLENDRSGTLFTAALNCSHPERGVFTVTLQKLSDFEEQYARVRPHAALLLLSGADTAPSSTREESRANISQIFVRSQPRASDPVAGFCIQTSQSLPFEWMVGSNRGPVAMAGHVHVQTMSVDAAANEKDEPEEDVTTLNNRGETSQFCFVDVTAAEEEGQENGQAQFIDVKTLKGRAVVGRLKMAFRAGLDDSGPSPQNQILPSPSYRDPYLVVGLASLPANPAGTPAGYLKPWWAFRYGSEGEWSSSDLNNENNENNEKKMCAAAIAADEEFKDYHQPPGGAKIQVRFRAATYRFRTYYEVHLFNADWRQE